MRGIIREPVSSQVYRKKQALSLVQRGINHARAPEGVAYLFSLSPMSKRVHDMAGKVILDPYIACMCWLTVGVYLVAPGAPPLRIAATRKKQAPQKQVTEAVVT